MAENIKFAFLVDTSALQKALGNFDDLSQAEKDIIQKMKDYNEEVKKTKGLLQQEKEALSALYKERLKAQDPAQIQKLNQEITKQKELVKGLTTDTVALGKAQQEQARAAAKAAKDTADAMAKARQESIQDVNQAISRLTGFSMQFGAAMAGAFAVQKVFEFGNAIIGLAGQAEQTKIAFTVMAKGVGNATTLLKELEEYNKETIFELPGLEKAAKTLLSFQVDVKDVLPTIKMLGDVSAGTGKDLAELSLIYGQVHTAGKAFTQDMNQLAVAGIPIWKELAAVMQTSPAAVRKMVEDGKVKFEDVQKVFQNMTKEGGQFYKMNKEQSISLFGMWSKLTDILTLMWRNIGTAWLPFAKNVVSWLGNMADGISRLLGFTRNWSDEIKHQVGEFDKLHISLKVVSAAINALTESENGLRDSSEKYNMLLAEKKELIKTINQAYGEYLPALLQEGMYLHEINDLLKVAREMYLEHLKTQAYESLTKQITENLKNAMKEQLEAQIALKNKVTNGQFSITDIFVGAGTSMPDRIRQLKAANEDVIRLEKNQAQALEILEKRKAEDKSLIMKKSQEDELKLNLDVLRMAEKTGMSEVEIFKRIEELKKKKETYQPVVSGTLFDIADVKAYDEEIKFLEKELEKLGAKKKQVKEIKVGDLEPYAIKLAQENNEKLAKLNEQAIQDEFARKDLAIKDNETKEKERLKIEYLAKLKGEEALSIKELEIKARTNAKYAKLLADRLKVDAEYNKQVGLITDKAAKELEENDLKRSLKQLERVALQEKQANERRLAEGQIGQVEFDKETLEIIARDLERQKQAHIDHGADTVEIDRKIQENRHAEWVRGMKQIVLVEQEKWRRIMAMGEENEAIEATKRYYAAQIILAGEDKEKVLKLELEKADKIAEIRTKNLNRTTPEADGLLGLLNFKKRMDGERKIFLEQMNSRLQALRNAGASEADILEEQTKMWGEHMKRRTELIHKFVNNIKEVYSILTEAINKFADAALEKELNTIDNQQKEHDKSIENKENKLSELEKAEEKAHGADKRRLQIKVLDQKHAIEAEKRQKEELEAKKELLERQAAQRRKAFAIADAIINTALAITRVLADVPKFDFGISTGLLVALYGIQGAAQVAAISAQKFNKGVLNLQGPGTETSDSIPAYLSKGESVMTAGETKLFGPTLEAIRFGKVKPEILNSVVKGSGASVQVTQTQFDDSRIVASNEKVLEAIHNITIQSITEKGIRKVIQRENEITTIIESRF